jgi:hypothetical protein
MPRQRSPRPDRRHQAGGAISDPPAGDIGQLAALLNQAGAGGRGRRSSLARWLHTHHDAFAVMLADKRPVWEDVATALAAMGLRDGTGKPPIGERVRKAWHDVQRAKAEQARRRAAVPTALGPGEIAPAIMAVPAAAVFGSVEAGASVTRESGMPRPRLQLDIRPATPLHETPASAFVPITPPPSHAVEAAAASSPSATHAAEQLRRLSEQMDAARTPLPKIVP